MKPESTTEIAAALHRTLRALQTAGKLKEAAQAIGEHRRWARSRCPVRTQQTWTASLLHMLEQRHRFRLGFEDYLIIARILGGDVADVAEFARAA